MPLESSRIQLVTRGDDAGSCDSANRAVVEACERGIVRNASVMVPGPAFAAAAELLCQLVARRTDICVGLHVTLNAEWDEVKWGPVLPPADVPTLVEPDGHFTSTPSLLGERRASVEEMIGEVQAQLQKARAHGLAITYIDEHMGVGRVGGLRERIAELARREGLVDASALRLSRPEVAPTEDLAGGWLEWLRGAAPGTYLLVTHPGYDTDEMRSFYHAGLDPGQVARVRDAERQALCDPRLLRCCHEQGIELARYTEVVEHPPGL